MPSENSDGARPRLHAVKARLSYLPRALRLIGRAAGWWTPVWGVLLLVSGLLPGATVYLTKVLVDRVAAAMGGGTAWADVQLVVRPAVLMIGALLLQQLLGSLVTWVRTAQAEYVQDHVKDLIHQKATSVELAFYETPSEYDHLEQANSEAATRSLSLLEQLGSVAQSSITLATISVILLRYGVWVPLVLVGSTLPALYVIVRHKQRYHAWWKQRTPDRRRLTYYDRLITHEMAAAEVRIFDLGDHFRTAYKAMRQQIRGERLDLVKDENIARFGAGLAGLVATGGVMGWLGWRALHGAATLGDLALFYRAFDRGQGLMRTLLHNAGQMYTDTLFLEHLFTLLEREPQIEEPDDPAPVPRSLREGIAFEEVTFRYPQTERAALESFNIFIPAGKTVAIVGANGAGKSTLAKLLCRFYDPQEGRVTLDGTDVRHFQHRALLDRITMMFQLPVRYQAPAAKNIAMGEVSRQNDRTSIERAAHNAMIHDMIMDLPDQYDTHLGKWFGDGNGTELSGGQWQRVTLARAFFREAPIVVLDEPTSAMDSWAENEWLDRFTKLVEDKTAIIITHRFTTAMCADLIYVMDRGQVVESGDHDELMAQNGLYAQSWRQQTQRHAHRRNGTTPPTEASSLEAQSVIET